MFLSEVVIFSLKFLKVATFASWHQGCSVYGRNVSSDQISTVANIFTIKNYEGLTSRNRWEQTFVYLDRLALAFQESSEEKVRIICLAAINMLHCFMRDKEGESETAAAFHWALEVDHVFMKLSKYQTSEALLVFCAYGVLLHS